MLKFVKEDHLNCSSCGYGSCDTMVVAIFNGLNKPENCHLYRQKQMEKEHAQIAELGLSLDTEIQKALAELAGAQKMIRAVSERSQEQSANLEESSAAIEQMIASIANSSRVSEEKQKAVEKLVGDARGGEEDMQKTVEGIAEITHSVEGIWEAMEVINGVASKTDLLSMNAAIEAAHAGEAGRGFSVVAAEIRKLAETTAENAKRISATLKTVAGGINSTAAISRGTGQVIHGMIQGIGGVAASITELINSLHEMSVGSSQITAALSSLRGVSEEVREAYSKMAEAAKAVESTMARIGSLSRENLKKIGAGSEAEAAAASL
jgi:methyl-accepting chemotaxis protein